MCMSSSTLYTYKRVRPQAPYILTHVYVLKQTIYLQTCMSSSTLYTYKRVCPQALYILTNVYVLNGVSTTKPLPSLALPTDTDLIVSTSMEPIHAVFYE